MISILISLVLFSSISFAQVSVYVSNPNIIINSSESKTVDVVVQNLGNPDKFSIRVFPPFAQSGNGQVIANFDKTVADIGTNQNATFELTFSAQACVADYVTNVFVVTASSILNSSEQGNQSIKITTLRKFPVCISKIDLSNDTLIPGETLTITTQIDNPSDVASIPFQLITNIRNSNGKIIQSYQNNIDIIQGQSNKIVTNNYNIPQTIGYGRFDIELILQNTQGSVSGSGTVSFVVQQFTNPTTQKSVNFGILTQDVFLNVKNDGNSVVNASTSETLPLFMQSFVTTVNNPDAVEVQGNNVVYTWLFYNLQPGEVRTVEYKINLWQIVLIFVLIIIAVAYAFTYVFTIRIVKKHRLFGPVAGTREIKIILEVKNRTRHTIRDVYVRDFLPSFANVVDKFDTLKPETIRKVQGGTEIIWKFNLLSSMDERVLTYRIRPTIEILGEVKLPRAIIKYSNKNRQMQKVVSKIIEVKL